MLKGNKLYVLDAVEGLRKLDDESVDLIVTDPPYNIASKGTKLLRRDEEGRLEPISTMETFDAWDSRHPFDHDLLIRQVIIESHRVLKKGGSLYMFTAEHDNGVVIRQARPAAQPGQGR